VGKENDPRAAAKVTGRGEKRVREEFEPSIDQSVIVLD